MLWKTMLMVNKDVVPLNRFTQTYIGNILRAICLSFGFNCQEMTFFINGEDIKIHTEDGDVVLIRDFAKEIVNSTLKGVLSPLKGIFWLQRISIKSKMSEGGVSQCWSSECGEW